MTCKGRILSSFLFSGSICCIAVLDSLHSLTR